MKFGIFRSRLNEPKEPVPYHWDRTDHFVQFSVFIHSVKINEEDIHFDGHKTSFIYVISLKTR